MGPVVDISELRRTLLHASDYYMECMCTFSSSHRTIKAGNYFSTLPRLLLAAALTRDYIYPLQKIVQWINAPLIPVDPVANWPRLKE